MAEHAGDDASVFLTERDEATLADAAIAKAASATKSAHAVWHPPLVRSPRPAASLWQTTLEHWRGINRAADEASIWFQDGSQPPPPPPPPPPSPLQMSGSHETKSPSGSGGSNATTATASTGIPGSVVLSGPFAGLRACHILNVRADDFFAGAVDSNGRPRRPSATKADAMEAEAVWGKAVAANANATASTPPPPHTPPPPPLQYHTYFSTHGRLADCGPTPSPDEMLQSLVPALHGTRVACAGLYCEEGQGQRLEQGREATKAFPTAVNKAAYHLRRAPLSSPILDTIFVILSWELSGTGAAFGWAVSIIFAVLARVFRLGDALLAPIEELEWHVVADHVEGGGRRIEPPLHVFKTSSRRLVDTTPGALDFQAMPSRAWTATDAPPPPEHGPNALRGAAARRRSLHWQLSPPPSVVLEALGGPLAAGAPSSDNPRTREEALAAVREEALYHVSKRGGGGG